MVDYSNPGQAAVADRERARRQAEDATVGARDERDNNLPSGDPTSIALRPNEGLLPGGRDGMALPSDEPVPGEAPATDTAQRSSDYRPLEVGRDARAPHGPDPL